MAICASVVQHALFAAVYKHDCVIRQFGVAVSISVMGSNFCAVCAARRVDITREPSKTQRMSDQLYVPSRFGYNLGAVRIDSLVAMCDSPTSVSDALSQRSKEGSADAKA